MRTKTIAGRTIKATPNHSARTFTIRTESAKFRTNRMSKEDFESELNNTPNDWQTFLNYSTDYFKVD